MAVSDSPRPSAIRRIAIPEYPNWGGRQIRRFLEDSQYQPPENLHQGTNDFTGPIHRQVREQWLTREFDSDVLKVLKDIDRDAVQSDKERIVWRGLCNVDPKSLLAMAREGAILFNLPPTSTSLNLAVGGEFGKIGDDIEILMKITIPEGTWIVVHNAEQMEVLLKQRFQWRIDRIDLNVPLHENDKKTGIVRKVIQATVLPANSK